MSADWYDKQGKPISDYNLIELKLRDPNYKVVGDDYLGNDLQRYRVSTVWLGLDHNYSGGDPIIFETMVFEDKLVHAKVPAIPKYGLEGLEYKFHPSMDNFTRRYHTLAEAEAGHKEVVAEVKERMKR